MEEIYLYGKQDLFFQVEILVNHNEISFLNYDEKILDATFLLFLSSPYFSGLGRASEKTECKFELQLVLLQLCY